MGFPIKLFQRLILSCGQVVNQIWLILEFKYVQLRLEFYNPLEKKIRQKSKKKKFESKGYKFYYLNRNVKIVECITIKFLENDVGYSESFVLENIFVEHNQIVVLVLVIQENVISQLIEIISKELG